MVIGGRNYSVALLLADLPWASSGNSAVDTIWDLLWHLYTGRVDTTYPVRLGIDVDGYGCCMEDKSDKFRNVGVTS